MEKNKKNRLTCLPLVADFGKAVLLCNGRSNWEGYAKFKAQKSSWHGQVLRRFPGAGSFCDFDGARVDPRGWHRINIESIRGLFFSVWCHWNVDRSYCGMDRR